MTNGVKYYRELCEGALGDIMAGRKQSQCQSMTGMRAFRIDEITNGMFSSTKCCTSYMRNRFAFIDNEYFQVYWTDCLNIFAQKIDCGYTLEPPQSSSNEYTRSMVWSKQAYHRIFQFY